jgi:4-hydroxybutyrate dehydrogenase
MALQFRCARGVRVALIQYLTSVEFECGAVSTLPAALAELNVRIPLVVTDRGLVPTGLVARVNAMLGEQYAVFSETPSNPTEDAVLQALATYRENSCDGVIALGGGSSIDLAKAVALLATHAAPLEQYALILGGAARITASVAPIVAIPTTAGTGSEVGRGALITLRDHRKLGLISPHLIPRRAICDPELTVGLPPLLTAATGMDALTHCIETFLSPKVNPPADAIALDGAQRAWRWIERAVADGGDLDARWNMMMASLQGAMAFQKGLGAVHSLSHPLGGASAVSLHHGTLNAVFLPPVLRFNAPACEPKLAKLREAFGLSQSSSVADEIQALNQRLGLPRSLKQMGVDRDLLRELVSAALKDHSTATNPRVLTADDVQRLFDDAFEA